MYKTQLTKKLTSNICDEPNKYKGTIEGGEGKEGQGWGVRGGVLKGYSSSHQLGNIPKLSLKIVILENTFFVLWKECLLVLYQIFPGLPC